MIIKISCPKDNEHDYFIQKVRAVYNDLLFEDGSISEGMIEPKRLWESKNIYCADCGAKAKVVRFSPKVKEEGRR